MQNQINKIDRNLKDQEFVLPPAIVAEGSAISIWCFQALSHKYDGVLSKTKCETKLGTKHTIYNWDSHESIDSCVITIAIERFSIMA